MHDRSYGRDNPDNIIITESLLNTIKTPLNFIRNSILLDLFILYLIHPTKQIEEPRHKRLISLLSISCGSIYNDNPEMMINGNSGRKGELNLVLGIHICIIYIYIYK
jgi:hypothetical protein